MDYRYEFVDGPFQVIVTTAGKADGDAIAEGRHRVWTDPRFRPEMNILVDHTLLDMSDRTADDLRMSAASASRDPAEAGTGYIALVCPSPLQFGLARMYHAFATGPLGERLVVVDSVDEAYRWLAERQSEQAHR